MAGIDMAATHAHIDEVNPNRFTSDLTLIGLGNFIWHPPK
jgi:hypothetical protein